MKATLFISVVAFASGLALAESQPPCGQHSAGSACAQGGSSGGRPVASSQASNVLWAKFEGSSTSCPMVFVSCGTAVADSSCVPRSSRIPSGQANANGKIKVTIPGSKGTTVYTVNVRAVARHQARSSTTVAQFPPGTCQSNNQVKVTAVCSQESVTKSYGSTANNSKDQFQVAFQGRGSVNVWPNPGKSASGTGTLTFQNSVPAGQNGLPLFLKQPVGKAWQKCLAGFSVGNTATVFTSVKHLADLRREVSKDESE